MPHRLRVTVVLAALAALGIACPGDRAESDQGNVAPLPDGVTGWETRPVDEGIPPQPKIDGPVLDGPASPDSGAQGTSCQGSGVQLSVDQPPEACATVKLTAVASQAYTWVMAGIKAPTTTIGWTGGASASCNGTCTWVFDAVAVPCQPGPYTLHLMRDATNDDPSVGTEVASCTP
jgi:hypothetical protein